MKLYPITDYAAELNAAHAAARRRRLTAWLGITTGLVLGGIGLGSLCALSSPAHALLLLACALWFCWSINTISRQW